MNRLLAGPAAAGVAIGPELAAHLEQPPRDCGNRLRSRRQVLKTPEVVEPDLLLCPLELPRNLPERPGLPEEIVGEVNDWDSSGRSRRRRYARL